jgi:ribosomal-protein-alanine N-acetyltransferase
MKLLPESDLTAIRISVMRRRHVRHIQKIEHQVYPRPWSPAVFAGEIDQIGRGRMYVVAHAGRHLVGYAGLMVVPDSAHITNVAVDPSQQQHAIGTRLMLTLARESIKLGCPAMTLEVRVSNGAAQSLYRRFGFAPAGIRARYYEGTEDALVMWAHDIGESEYAERLMRIAAAVPGTTTWSEELQ